MINLLIFVGVVVLATRFRSGWESFEQENSLEGIVERAQQGGDQGPSAVEPMGRANPFSEFTVVSDKTLFAEGRRPEAQEEVVVQQDPGVIEQPPKWAARPMLHGVSAVGNKRLAVVTVFEGNQKQGELRSVEVGDLVQGYWVDEIGDTALRLRWGDRNEIIDMADATQPAGGGRPAIGRVTVINVGSAPSAVQTTSQDDQQEGTSVEVSVVGGSSSGQGGAARGGAARGAAAQRQGTAQPTGRESQQDDGVERFIEGR